MYITVLDGDKTLGNCGNEGNGNVTSFLNRGKEFEEAHYSCRQLLEERIKRIEVYVSKWILIALGSLLLLMSSGFVYFHYEFIKVRKKINHRYFNLKESLEDIHKVKIEQGSVIKNY